MPPAGTPGTTGPTPLDEEAARIAEAQGVGTVGGDLAAAAAGDDDRPADAPAPATPPEGRPILRGVLWMLASLSSLIAVALASRELASGMPILEILVLRSLVGLLVLLALLPRLWPELRQGRDVGLNLLRNAVHFGGQFTWTIGIALLPLAQVFALEFTMPIWVAVFAYLILGERIPRVRKVAIALGFVGVLVVLQPGAQGSSLAALWVLVAAACYGASAVLVKRLTAHASSAVIVAWMVIMQLPMGLALMAVTGGWVMPGTADLPWIVVIGLAALSAHYTMAQALRTLDASVAIPIDFLRVPLIAIIGWLFYGETVSAAVFIGAGIIFGANYWAMRAELRARRA